MKPILTCVVFCLICPFVYAQQEPPPDSTSFPRWEVLLTSNMRYKYTEAFGPVGGYSHWGGRNHVQVGYHLSRSFIMGVESSISGQWDSFLVQSYFKFRKPMGNRFFGYVKYDVGWQRSPFSSVSRTFIEGELVEEIIREGHTEKIRMDLTVGFEYVFAKRLSAIANVNFVEGEGLGLRYNF